MTTPKHASAKRSPARLRAREDALLVELCDQHGYAFSDTLPARDRSTMLASRKSGRLQIQGGIVVKLVVPAGGALGRRIIAMREEKKP